MPEDIKNTDQLMALHLGESTAREDARSYQDTDQLMVQHLEESTAREDARRYQGY